MCDTITKMDDSNNNKEEEEEEVEVEEKDNISDYTKDDFLVQGLEEIVPSYSMFNGTMYAGRIPINHTLMVDEDVEDDEKDNEQQRNQQQQQRSQQRRIGKTMFWLFEPHTQLIPNTIVLWLNGGPGCSSFNCGIMMEHSPVTQPLHNAGYCCLKDNKPQLSYNKYTWTNITTMLYVEHPWGTGYSYGIPEPQNELDASSDLYIFLQNFYKLFPHLSTHELYIFGES